MGQRPCSQKIVGFTTFGMAVPLLRGAEDPPPGDQNQQGHQQYQQQQPPPTGQPDPNAQQQQNQQPDPNAPDPNATVSRAEYDALMQRMQAADRNKSEQEKKLREFEDRDKSELEKAQRDAQEATARAEKAEKELQESHIEREFLKLPDMNWHDPGDALRLLDRSAVEVKEDGTVTGVKEAADKLAKEKQFLVKPTEGGNNKDSGKQNNGNNGSTTSGSSGASSTGNNPAPPNGSNNKSADRERLEKKFPQLGRR